MKTKILTLLVAICATTILGASNVITYMATEKLTETTSANSSGLHTNAFNVAITSHTFSNGTGTITFASEVTTIGDSAFYDCSNMTSITIPNSIITIGNYAFSYCSGLTSVTIPNSVTTIGNYAFYHCYSWYTTGLTSIIIPNSVSVIGDYAFCECSSLTSVTIPNSVTTIGIFAFGGCEGLTSINVDAANTHYCSMDGVLFNYAKDTFIQYPIGNTRTDYTIPNSVTTIGEGAFYGCRGLTSVMIGNSVTTIKEAAFLNCTGLTSIEIPNSVTKIGEWAFNWCSNLNTILISNNIEKLETGVFCGCSALTFIKIPKSITSIGNSAFASCENLKDISVSWTSSEQLPIMGDNVFMNIAFWIGPSGATLHVPVGSTSIYQAAGVWQDFGTFIEPKVGDKFEVDGLWYEITSIGEPNMVKVSQDNSKFISTTSIIIPESVICNGSIFVVSEIEGRAFANSQLSSVIIPNSVTTIGDEAFYKCTSLTSITIGNSVKTIRERAFNECSGLTSIEIPNSVTTIEDLAFLGCTGLTSITIPNSVTTIGEGAFYCSNLTSFNVDASNIHYSSVDGVLFNYVKDTLIQYPIGNTRTEYTILNSVKTIGNDAFDDCDSLTSITIPNSVTTIGKWAFAWCDGLTSIEIPNSVTTIGEGAFYECPILTSVTIGNSVTTIDWNTFEGCSNLTSVTIKSNNIVGESYSNRYNLKNIFGEQVKEYVIGNSVTTIGEWAFATCSELMSVTIGNSVTEIEDSAFKDCMNIKEVHWDAKKCNSWNFGSQVEIFVLGNDVQIIPASICKEMSKLTSITIPNSVTTIGESAFENCTYLKTVTLGKSLTDIGCNAFKGDYRIEEITSYAEVTPNVCSTTFDGLSKQYIYLYVPEKSIRGYQVDPNWNEFDIRTKAAEVTPIDGEQPIVVPSDNNVTITWPITDGANTYSITITKEGKEVCFLTFNAQGQLTNIAFAAPGHNGSRQAPAATLTEQGYQFTITGLDKASKYNLTVSATDSNNKVIKTYTSSFATTGYVPQNYAIVAKSSDNTKGTVSGSGTYEEFTKATLTAIPAAHYHFVQWNDGNTDNPRSIVVENDATFTAEFAINQYTITTLAENGSISGAGTYDYGTQVTLEATPAEGYEFVKWSNEITDNPYTFIIEQDIEITAIFKEILSGWEDVHNATKATKYLHNGQLIIDRNGQHYSAMGERRR